MHLVIKPIKQKMSTNAVTKVTGNKKSYNAATETVGNIKMCGIIGMIDVAPVADISYWHALRRLEYRGYDSVSGMLRRVHDGFMANEGAR